MRGRESRNQSLNTKLTATEFAEVERAAAAQRVRLGRMGSRCDPARVAGGSASDPSLAEILGVRLLLVNVLRPLAAGQRLAPEAFDKLLDEISEAKHQLAGKLATPAGRK